MINRGVRVWVISLSSVLKGMGNITTVCIERYISLVGARYAMNTIFIASRVFGYALNHIEIEAINSLPVATNSTDGEDYLDNPQDPQL